MHVQSNATNILIKAIKICSGQLSDQIFHQKTGPGFDTWSGNILSFLLPLFQEGQLSVTSKSMCTKY